MLGRANAVGNSHSVRLVAMRGPQSATAVRPGLEGRTWIGGICVEAV